jgi:hypothetical protein
MPRYSKAEVQESLARLRKLCPPGTTVHCVLRHVSRSGMMRHISLFKGTQPISWDAARVLGYSLNDGRAHWAVKVGGCGMDMGFHLVNSLSYALHGHKDRGEDAIEKSRLGHPFTPRRGHFRAGYSLKRHEWL